MKVSKHLKSSKEVEDEEDETVQSIEENQNQEMFQKVKGQLLQIEKRI